MDDYVLSAVLKKNQDNEEFILFDESGKILGITESIHQILLFNSNIQNGNEFDGNILNSYLYFWFRDLLLKINDQKDELQRQQTSFIKDHENFRKQHLLNYTQSLETQYDPQTDQKQLFKITCFESNYINQINQFINDQLFQFYQNSIYFQITFTLHFMKMYDCESLFRLSITEYLQKSKKYV